MEATRTYKIGDTTYDYDSMEKRAKYYIDEYINSIEGGKSNYDKYFSAFNNMLSGVGDGTVYYDPAKNKFVDTLGRYLNIDFYLKMASPLLSFMKDGLVYRDPKVAKRLKYKNATTLGNYIFEDILGPNANITDFILLDQDIDPTTNLRSQSVRAKLLYDKIGDLIKIYDSKFDDPDAANTLARLGEAQKALSDGVISENEYLALNRALGLGRDTLNKLFYQGDLAALSKKPDDKPTILSPDEWMRENHPRYTGNLASFKFNFSADRDLTNWEKLAFNNLKNSESLDYFKNATLNLLLRGLNWKDDSVFKKYIGTGTNISMYYQLYILLNTLDSKGGLVDLGDGTKLLEGDSTSYIYNPSDNSIKQVHNTDVDLIAKRWTLDYLNYKQGVSGEGAFMNRYILQNKTGGILKFQAGNTFKNTALDAIFYEDDDLKDDKRMRHIKSGTGFGLSGRDNVVATHVNKPDTTRYDEEDVGLGKSIESGQLYLNWLNILLNNEKVASAWASRYKALNPVTDYQYKAWYNADGSFNFENFKQGIKRGDVVGKSVYNDGLNGIGHDLYRGRAYRVKGTNEYYSAIPEGYELTKDPTYLDESGLVNVYTLTKKPDTKPDTKSTTVTPDPGIKTEVDPIEGRMSAYTPPKRTFSDFARSIAPDLLDVADAFDTIRTNNLINQKILDRHAHNDVMAPYRYHYQEGNYAALNSGQQEYANTMNLANNHQTTDSLVNSALMLDADTSGWNKVWQSVLADNQTIQTNRKIAEEYADWSNEQAVQARNENSKLHADASNTKLEAEISKDLKNLQTRHNLISSISNRMRVKADEKKQLSDSFALYAGSYNIQQQYAFYDREFNRRMEELENNGQLNSDYYRQLGEGRAELARQRELDILELKGSILGTPYTRYLYKSPTQIRSTFLYPPKTSIV